MTDHVKAIVDGVRPMIEVVDAKAKALEARVDDLSNQMRSRSSLPGVEPKKFSFVKAINAIKTNDFSDAGYEAEVFNEMRKKALRFGDGAQGGYMVPDEFRNDLLTAFPRANNVLFNTNVLRVTSSGGAPIRIPKVSSGVSGGWIGENGTAGTSPNAAADQTYAEITLSPKRSFAATIMSNTLIRRDAASAETIVRADLSAAVMETLDAGYLVGSGTAPAPTGISNASGVSSVSGSGSDMAVNMQKLWEALQTVETNKGSIDGCIWVMHPKTWYYMLSALYQPSAGAASNTATLVYNAPAGNSAAIAGFNQLGQKTILGLPVYLTTNIAVTAATPDTSTILLYNPQNTIYAEFGPMEILVTNAGYTLGLQDQTLVRVVQEVDFGVRQAAQVVKITGVYAGP